MKYVFVLGRNPLLSTAEVLSYFEREGISAKDSVIEANALLVDVEKPINVKEIISRLGGTIAIGRVLIFNSFEKAIEEIKTKRIYLGRDNKVVYSVLNFAGEEEFNNVLDAVKENFWNERLKARYKGVSGTIKLQNGRIARGSPEKILLRDMNYFVFEDKDKKELNFGLLEASYDSAEAEKKDMEKPYRREELAISPRLARILINLSQVKEKETLLDPFCGIGVILGEALLGGINVVGIDIEGSAINNARKNITWLKNNYKFGADFKLINDDSRKARVEGISGIATEPHLGELLRAIPSKERAEDMAMKFEDLMIDVLNNLKKGLKKGAKVAFSSPLIKSQKGRIGCNIENIAQSTGLKIYQLKGMNVEFPISEFREEQTMGRGISVLIL